MRANAPVGQFSSQPYAGVLAPGGLSEVSLQRLHLTASRSSACSTGGGSGSALGVSHRRRLPRALLSTGVRAGVREGLEMAVYWQFVAQSPQPMHVPALISICPEL